MHFVSILVIIIVIVIAFLLCLRSATKTGGYYTTPGACIVEYIADTLPRPTVKRDINIFSYASENAQIEMLLIDELLRRGYNVKNVELVDIQYYREDIAGPVRDALQERRIKSTNVHLAWLPSEVRTDLQYDIFMTLNPDCCSLSRLYAADPALIRYSGYIERAWNNEERSIRKREIEALQQLYNEYESGRLTVKELLSNYDVKSMYENIIAPWYADQFVLMVSELASSNGPDKRMFVFWPHVSGLPTSFSDESEKKFLAPTSSVCEVPASEPTLQDFYNFVLSTSEKTLKTLRMLR